MKSSAFILGAMFAATCLFIGCNNEAIVVNQVPMTWQYDVPAMKYWESMPVGTGRFGAMVPGSTDLEVIPFNDETLWTGGPYNPNNPDGPAITQRLRELCFAHDWAGATKIVTELNSRPTSVQYYQPMGRLNLQYGHDLKQVKDYRRVLNMDDALVEVDYALDGVKYSRRVFASYPDQVIVMRLTADKKGKVNFSTWLTSLQTTAKMHVEGNSIIMEGTTIDSKPNETILPPQMRWQSRVQIIPEGGTLKAEGDKLVIADADAATVILAGATNWVNWNDVSANEKQRCIDYITQAAKHPYNDLLQRHLDDYRPLFASCKLDLGPDAHPNRTTTQSMDSIRNGENDPAYEARYFQYGRYLMLAGAREKTLAFNNHNMWLNDLDGRWRGRWTLNINIQECYWPVECTNMPEINESLLLFVENLAQAGARTAKELHGCRGWCAYHGTDVWFNTAPTDGIPQCTFFALAGAWLMQQLYDHYEYNPDPAYLERIYPLLKGATEFCIDYFVPEPKTGYRVSCPSTSPENAFIDEQGRYVAISFGASGEVQMARRVARDYVEAATLLNKDPETVKEAKELLEHLPPHQIGQFGQLQEWFYDFKEAEVTHRHTSHLFALYPDDDITVRKTPKLAEAARVVLQRRGNINMGWSGAWKISQHARLNEPEESYKILHKMLTDVSIHPSAEDSQITPSFEGNQAIQGITAGMVEMILRNSDGEIHLLPALPKAWDKGSVKGLRARGGFEIAMAWDKGALTAAQITAHYDNKCRLRTNSPVTVTANGKEVTATSPEANVLEFDAKAGTVYQLRIKF